MTITINPNKTDNSNASVSATATKLSAPTIAVSLTPQPAIDTGSDDMSNTGGSNKNISSGRSDNCNAVARHITARQNKRGSDHRLDDKW